MADTRDSTRLAAAMEADGDAARLSTRTQTILVAWLVVYATIGQRLYIPRGLGEAFPLAAFLSVALAVAVLVTNRGARKLFVRRLRETPWFLALVAVWTALGLAGPIVGYPVRTVVTAFTPLSITALAAIGFLISAQPGADRRAPYTPLLIVVWVQFVLGTMQALWYTGIVRLPPQRWLYLWDTAASHAYGVEQIAGRSVGLFLNPNPYSLLGAIIVIFALTLRIDLRQRLLLGLPALGIVLLGASRSALLALLVISIPLVIRRMWGVRPSRALAAMAATGAGAGLLIVASALTKNVLFLRFTSRWASLPELFAVGANADPNAAGRVGAWGMILSYWSKHPLGTFGPPQMAVSSFTDNDYITLLVQGGVVLLLAYLGTLISALLSRERSPVSTTVVPLVSLVALTGFTQTTMIMAPTLALFWPVLGTTIGRLHEPGERTANLGPRRSAAEARGAALRQRRTTVLLSGALIFVVVGAVGLRLAGKGFTFPDEIPPDYTRPRSSVEASTTVPGWRVDVNEQLGTYYVDLPLSERPDRVEDFSSPTVSAAEERRLAATWEPSTAEINGRSQVIAVAVAIQGLHDYTRYLATGDERFAESSRRAADWLVSEQERDGSWRYRYAIFDLSPGWASANMQSTAISLLCRAYQDHGDAEYLAAAKRAYRFMMRPVADGGVLGTFRNEQPVLQGYANSSVSDDALSGALVGLLGIHDLAFVTEDQKVWDTFELLWQSMAAHLGEYDVRGWSRYSLGIARGPASHPYHRLYIAELRVLDELTQDPRFGSQADRWQRNLDDWVVSLDAGPE